MRPSTNSTRRALIDVGRYRRRWCLRVRAIGVFKPGESENTEVQGCVRCESPLGFGLLSGYPNALQTSSIRADDHSTIGGIIFAVITPALFWKRANSINCKRPVSPRLYL